MSVFLQPIYTQTVSSGVSSVTFNNIPQTFTDLKFVVSARDTTTPGSPFLSDNIYVRFNGDSSSLYSTTVLYGDSTAVGSARNIAGTNAAYVGIISNNTNAANFFSSGEIYLPNYTASNNKSFTAESVAEAASSAAGSVYQVLTAGLYRSTSSISSITFYPGNLNFMQYSTFSLYGITKG